VSHFLQSNESAFCRLVRAQLPARHATGRVSPWAERLMRIESAYWEALEEESPALLWDGGAVMDLLASLPGDALLFAGNSLPIRHVDQFSRPRERSLHVFANRGASGIDGNLSTALGLAAATGRHITALLGDITLYHDLNALHLMRRHRLPATVVVLNNDGGGIFRRLPVRDFEPEFAELFVTPHGLDFAHAAAMFELRYARADSVSSLREGLIASRQASEPMLIEVRTAGDMDAAHYQQLSSRVLARLRYL
jgi:2-succinyl-5-enolpyruvyl-6-hydroxy-3-cyclohexene-1-carboxylate synthase